MNNHDTRILVDMLAALHDYRTDRIGLKNLVDRLMGLGDVLEGDMEIQSWYDTIIDLDTTVGLGRIKGDDRITLACLSRLEKDILVQIRRRLVDD